ncbi:hypothetical protein Acor_79440 [Acrocarpospora corrugata]|uniref:Uncharacterized protein n=1 Tax=Acrocarpospora corrugata TaxID=35763 RepID=A0A5M3W9Y3_9ACTN|nr:hypothetical protein Acor_79440 [Acrocarpospora corrugata]
MLRLRRRKEGSHPRKEGVVVRLSREELRIQEDLDQHFAQTDSRPVADAYRLDPWIQPLPTGMALLLSVLTAVLLGLVLLMSFASGDNACSIASAAGQAQCATSSPS